MESMPSNVVSGFVDAANEGQDGIPVAQTRTLKLEKACYKRLRGKEGCG
jgi:hypothetical protein